MLNPGWNPAARIVLDPAEILPKGASNAFNSELNSYLGSLIIYNLTDIAAGQSVALTLYGVAPDGTAFVLAETTEIANTGKFVFCVYPGAGAEGAVSDTTYMSLSCAMPLEWYLQESFSDTSGTLGVTRACSAVGLGRS